jgi:hypothetical protein
MGKDLRLRAEGHCLRQGDRAEDRAAQKSVLAYSVGVAQSPTLSARTIHMLANFAAATSGRENICSI